MFEKAKNIFALKDINVRCFRFTNTIFIHIPKNAGQSIARTFYGHTVHHKKAFMLKKNMPLFYDNAFVFACVRDPLDRFKSAYSYISAGGRSDNDKKIHERYVKGKDIDSFIDYLASVKIDKCKDLYHFHTQSSYVSEKYNLYSLIIDRVYRMNEMDALMRDFKTNSLQAPMMDDFPILNKSNSVSLTLTKAQEDKVKDLYMVDYVNFY